MSAVPEEAVPVAAPGHPVGRPVPDPLIAAERNLVRMPRTPEPARSCRPGFISPRLGGRRRHVVKGQVK
jgi:hypothetical protein